MNYLVTGGAGFIANTLITHLLEDGGSVFALDNFKLGQTKHLVQFSANPCFKLIQVDVASRTDLKRALENIAQQASIDEVWHLAANSDIPRGVAEPDVDLQDTFLTTFELLRSLRNLAVKRFMFASSSAIYGDHGEVPIHELTSPLFPISNYGAMKLASEAQISAATESFLPQAILYRFPNVVGIPATHGVILDFIRKLAMNPGELHVLGNGSQQKAYLHVADLVDAMLQIREVTKDRLSAFNIGPVDSGVTVRWIAEKVVERVSPKSQIIFGKGNKGWVGDVPQFKYSTAKVQALGWRPKLGSEAAVLRAIDQIARQEGF